MYCLVEENTRLMINNLVFLTPEEAKNSGALGFFVDKYQTSVSVYSVGDFSKEICTGPHVKNTSEIGKFKIQKQRNIGTGLMRIRAKIDP